MGESHNVSDPISHLFENLRKDSPRLKDAPKIDPQELKIGQVSIVLEPE
jgi:hypothetical protein